MSIQVGGNTTVRELAGRYSQTRTVFEQYGVDYCCGGGKCLPEAAPRRGAADRPRNPEASRPGPRG